MGLRKGQRELVELYRGGYCAIPAIPGGGKTHCLSLWAAEMITKGLHKPGRILIVTYMNSAVNNFKQRISRELANKGVSGNKDYFVSTIHGLCLQIIKEKPDLMSANDEFEIIDGISKTNLISSSIEEWRSGNEEKFRQYIDEDQLSPNRVEETCKTWKERLCNVVQTSIGDFKSRGLNPGQARSKCKVLSEDSILKCIADIYEIYDRKLKMAGFLDFDDMLYNAKRLLEEDKLLLEKYQRRYSFVCEDEAQDSNLIQSHILSMIAQGNLLRVGDSNQAICGSFTNSDFRYFKEFCQHPDTRVFNITQSSRNTRDIIDLANYFVRYVRGSHPVEECRESLLPQFIEPVNKDDERQNPSISEYGIKSKIFSSWEEEAAAIVTQAFHMMKVYPEKSIAILIPTSWKINEVIKIMENRKIPFEELDNNSKERNGVLRKLGLIIGFIAAPESGLKLGEMFLECFYKENEEENVKSGVQQAKENEEQKELFLEYLQQYPIEELLYPLSKESSFDNMPQVLMNSTLWEDFIKSLDLVREMLDFTLIPVERLILYIADKLGFDREGRAIAQKVADDAKFMKQQNPQFRLSELAAELLSPRNVFSHFTGVVWDLKGYEPRPGVVTVCTYHKSKGLEWDIVFLGGLNYADFPVELNDKFIGEYWFLKQEYKNPQAMARADMQKIVEGRMEEDCVLASKIETISEKARLLYVGITRAKQYLFLSGFHANPGKKNETPPSKYLVELKRYIDEKTSI